MVRERDKKIDAAIRRIQRERLEFDETSKAEAEEEARRLEEVCVWGGGGGSTSFVAWLEILVSFPRPYEHRISDGAGVG